MLWLTSGRESGETLCSELLKAQSGGLLRDLSWLWHLKDLGEGRVPVSPRCVVVILAHLWQLRTSAVTRFCAQSFVPRFCSPICESFKFMGTRKDVFIKSQLHFDGRKPPPHKQPGQCLWGIPPQLCTTTLPTWPNIGSFQALFLQNVGSYRKGTANTANTKFFQKASFTGTREHAHSVHRT